MSSSSSAAAPNTDICPACGAHDHIAVLVGGLAPVTSGTTFLNVADATAVQLGRIDLVCCRACALIFNNSFDPSLGSLGARYESTQASSAHFSAFAKSLAEDWIARHGLAGKRILEVGSGQGDFIVEILKGGAQSAIALDPLALSSDIPEQFRDRVEIIATEMSSDHANLRAEALICRHTLEHIAPVRDFLSLCADWSRANNGSPVLFEAPGADRILNEGAFWDLGYEHCNYFTEATLRRACQFAGMEVVRQDKVFGGQYLILEGRAAASAEPAVLECAAPDEIDAVASFRRTTMQSIYAVRRRFTEMAKQGPVIIWQAAAKTVDLMAWLGEDVAVSGAVDINPRRQGLFIPPYGMKVLSPTDLPAIGPAHVVLMNPVYACEVRNELDRLGLDATRLHTIDAIAGAADAP